MKTFDTRIFYPTCNWGKDEIPDKDVKCWNWTREKGLYVTCVQGTVTKSAMTLRQLLKWGGARRVT